jgi:class 3 adenylate cyclase
MVPRKNNFQPGLANANQGGALFNRGSSDSADRRQVTVMFSDLVGSTVLSARMDPGGPARRHFGLSEVRRGDRAPPRWVCGEIPGDGVLIYFGYPQAHEGDAERAVCAGLELVEAVVALKTPVSYRPVSALRLGWLSSANVAGSEAENVIKYAKAARSDVTSLGSPI